LAVVLASGSGNICIASDPPDSEVNPWTSNIELVDSVRTLSNCEVRHVINNGEGEPPAVMFLTSHPADDLRPRIEIESDGDTWVAWWRSAADDEVWIRRRDHLGGGWQAPRLISEDGEPSRNPDIVHDGSDAWIAYELEIAGGQIEIAARRVGEEPDPFGIRTVLAGTSFGETDTRIHFAAGRLWTTWIDSATDVGFSAYDYTSESWSIPSYESYAYDDVQQARGRIRATVTGP
jgi:hypothetical protein